MKSLTTKIVFLGLTILFLLSACKKSASQFDFNTAVTATVGSQNYKYLAPAGLVLNNTYEINGYQSDSANNTIILSVDSPNTANYQLSRTTPQFITIVNDGVTYGTNVSTGSGILNLTFSGKNVTGTFNGTLYSTAGTNVVVTNGTVSTTY